MRVVLNNVLPFRGFVAVNICGVVFARRDVWTGCGEGARQRCLRHERIHTAQMLELGVLPFYVLYFLEWLWRLVFRTRTAYSGISFEREARFGELFPDYLETRQKFAQWKH